MHSGAMHFQHVLGLVILCAGATVAEEVLDVTMLSRNFVYGPRSSPKLECYVPPGVTAHFGFSIKEILFPGVQFRPGKINGVYVLDVPQRVYPHARTNLYWCDVHGSAISTVTSPAMYYDASDGPTFLPKNFTVTADLAETVTLGVQGAPGYNHVQPHVTSWDKMHVLRRTVSLPLATGNVSTFTIRHASPGESGVYIASGPRSQSPGKNRAVMKLIVRGCRRDLWGFHCKRSCPNCKNGGRCHEQTGQCICPPGFKGRLCDEACGDDHFGRDCTHRCSSTNPDRSIKSCVDILMCLPDPYGCSCGTGFHGPFCNQRCPPHRYGADCKQSRVCNCETESHCDIFTGTCRRDGGKCRRGWRDAPFCDASYPIINKGPAVTNITDHRALVGFLEWSSKRDTGRGSPERYLIQYREAHGMWESLERSSLPAIGEYKVPLLHLHANTAYEVRVLVVDKDGNFREDGAKTTQFRTECGAPTLPPQDVSIDSSSTNAIVVTWKNPAPEHWRCGSVSVVLKKNAKSVELTTTPGTNAYRIPVTPYTRMEIQLRLKTPNNKYSEWTAKHIVTSAEDAPSVVRNVQLVKTKSHQVLCTWDPPEHANGIIRHYSVVHTPLAFRIPSCGQVKPNLTEVIVAPVHTAVNLTALKPYVKYQVSVSAVTIRPGPEYSMAFHTSADVPGGAPAEVKLERTTDTSASLTWSGLPCEIANGPNLTYYSELESDDQWDQNIRNTTTKETSFTYDNLVPFTRYRAKVFAQNVAGRSPNFSSLTFTTAATDPLPPTLLNTTMQRQDSVSLLWNAPYPPYGLLDHYQLKFFAANQINNITERVIAYTACASKKGLIEQHCYTVNGLEPNEIYYFSLRAKNRGTAYSPFSIEIEVKTKEAVPGPPVKLRVAYTGEPQSVKLLWDSPRRKNGLLLVYKVTCSLKHSFDDLQAQMWAKKSGTVNSSETSFYLRDLHPGSTYTTCVQASTSAGFGDPVCGNFVAKTAVPGHPNNLRSTEEGTDSLKIEWNAPMVKNGELTIYRVNSSLEHTFNDLHPDFWASKLAVVNASEATLFYLRGLLPGSTYRVCVQASTSAGFGEAVCGNLSTEASVPGAPGNVTSEEETTDSLKVHWDPPVEKNGALTTYQVNWTLEHTFDDLPQEMRAMKSTTVNASEATSFNLTHLSPGSTYRVCVRASTSAGFGEAVCGNIFTKTSIPGAPNNLRSTDEAADSLKIQWDAPTLKNGPLTSYWVSSILAHTFNALQSDVRASKSAALNASEGTSFDLRGLVPGSTYRVCVQASTSAGFGDAACGNFGTKASVPAAPSNLWSDEETTDRLTIHWDAPEEKNGPLEAYRVVSTLVHTFNDLKPEMWGAQTAAVNASEGTSLYLAHLSPGSTYNVCVQASNSAGFGEATCANMSSIASVPDAPDTLWSSEETTDSLKIHWDAPIQKNGALTSYQVNATLIHTFNDLKPESWATKSLTLAVAEGTFLYLGDLFPGSTSVVCVQASTSAGLGEALCGNFSTKESAPDAPENLWSSEENTDSLKINWKAPPQKNGALTGYQVNSTLAQTFNDLPAESWTRTSIVLNSSATTSFHLTKLSPGSTYSVCVQASTSAGIGDAVCKNFTTIVSVPDPPENLHLLEETERSLNIQWNPPSKRNGALNNYKVNSILTHTFNDLPANSLSPQSVIVNSSETASFFLRGLSPGSTYSVCIQASTNAGLGEAACRNFSTKVLVPDSPGNLRSLEKAEESLKIQWDPPVQKNGALTGYVVNSTLSQTFNDLPAEFWSQMSVVLNSSDTTLFYMTELSPGSTYSVCVQASTSAGVGDAVCHNFSTKVSVPGAPEGLRSLEQAEYSLKIEWNSPNQKNGALTGYKVNSTLVHTFNEMQVEALLTKSVVLNASETASFILPDLSPGSTYLVCIQASTEAGFGEAACNNFSTKVSIPGAAANVRTSEETENSLKIHWEAPRQRNGVLTSYKVNSSLAHTFNNIEGKPTSPSIVTLNASDSNELYLSHLIPGSVYFFCVQASTQAGFGKPVCKNFSTKASVPGVPESIGLLNATKQSLTITWDPPLESNGALTSYRVNFTLSHTFNNKLTASWLPETAVMEGSDTSKFHIKDLTPGSTYQVCVQASTSVGFGEAVCDNFSTKASVPEAPANIRLTEHDENSLKVAWGPPRQRNGALTGYKANSSLAHTLNYVPPDAWSPHSVTLDSSDKPEVYLQDLSPGSAYLVCIQASTTAGFGEATCQNFSTKISVPDSPQNLRSMEQSEDSIKIEWDPPRRPNGIVDEYRINLTLSHTFNDVPAESRQPKSVAVGNSNTTECSFKDLTPGSTYEVCIEASTSAGFGEAVCKNFSVKTSVPEAPENITLAEQNEHSLKIMWDPPRQKNGALTGYKANISLVRTFNNILPHLWPSKSLMLDAAENPEVCFQNLSPGSTYLICIEASTNAGFGEAACQNFSTNASTPESPHNFRSTMQTEDSLKIQWDPPHRANGAITGYTVNSCIVDTFNDVPEKSWCPNVVVHNVSATTEVYLQDLVAGSTYLICAQANTIAGFGEAVCDNFTTNSSVPGASEGIRALEKKEHSLKLMWDPPRQKNGALQSYKINSSLVHTFNGTLLDSGPSTSVALDASDPPIITLPDLFPGSTYLVCVQASTIAGVGEAVCKNFTTKASKPVPQVKPIAKISGHGEVTVVVSPIDYAKGPITGYYVIVGWETCNVTEPVKIVNATTALEMQLGYYVAAHLSPSDLNGSAVEVVVGRGHMIGGFENPPLTGGVAYCFGLLVETNFSGEVLYGYSLTAPLIVNSASRLPSLPVIIGAFSVFLLAIIVVATLTCCCLRRKSIAAKRTDMSSDQAAEEHGMSHVTTAHKTSSKDASETFAEPNHGLSSRPDLVKNLRLHETEGKQISALKIACDSIYAREHGQYLGVSPPICDNIYFEQDREVSQSVYNVRASHLEDTVD